MGSMLDRRRATDLARELDLDRLPACPMCLFDLAWQVKEGGRLHPSSVGRVASWVWPEIEDGLRQELVAARMREALYAEEGLRDLEERGCSGYLVRVVVEGLVRRLAVELANRA